MEPEYKELRECIYTNQEELDRFRQLVVNSVMATDIVDKELGGLRKKRWDMAFQQHDEDDAPESSPEPNTNVDINRKATIVIEHLIQVRHPVLPGVGGNASVVETHRFISLIMFHILQAADVAHTMQHWQ